MIRGWAPPEVRDNVEQGIALRGTSVPITFERRSSGGRTFYKSTSLTPRQKEVLELIARGLNNTQISERLNVGVKSVENYINSIYNTLGVQGGGAGRVQAVLLYFTGRGGAASSLPLILQYSSAVDRLREAKRELEEAQSELYSLSGELGPILGLDLLWSFSRDDDAELSSLFGED